MREGKKERRGKGNEERRKKKRPERGERGKEGEEKDREIATGYMNPPLHLPSS